MTGDVARPCEVCRGAIDGEVRFGHVSDGGVIRLVPRHPACVDARSTPGRPSHQRPEERAA